jgi:isoquinoline 1-oxidoreductase beta subunit
VWNGEQLQTGDQHAGRHVRLQGRQVTINMLYAGGSFGRRAKYPGPTTSAKRRPSSRPSTGTRAPVKLVWMREDDMRGGYYRPMFHHTLEAALDAEGSIRAWRHRLVGQSIAKGSPFEAFMVKDGIDGLSVEGAASLPYAIPNLQVDLHTPADIPVPVLWWRSVGSTHTAYSTETFIDRLAAEARQDPVALRLKLLEKHPRHAAVLRLAADKAGWGKPLAKGKPASEARPRGGGA